MQGILLVDKPINWTSFDVVNYVRKIIAQASAQKPKNIKVGHAGTLDPLATGLLVLLIGKEYTKRSESFRQLDKTYETTMFLGQSSTTADEEGDKTTISDYQPSLSEIQKSFRQFTGQISQKPPVFSAIKVSGKRSYRLARLGQAVELEPRPVNVYRIELQSYKYPLVKFRTDVGSGTYIRSLVDDIGQFLTTGAYVTKLCRLKIGDYNLQMAITVKDLTVDLINQKLICH